MKKVFLSLLFVVCCSIDMFAAKSIGNVRYIQQPDGTTLAIQLLGDEHFSWYQTLDGVLLTESDGAFYVADTGNEYSFGSIMNPESLSSTGVLAHDMLLRSADEVAAIDSQDRNAFFSTADYSMQVQQSKQSISNMLTYIPGYPSESSFSPHHGKVRIPIILMNYADTVFTCGSTTAIDKAKIYEIFTEYFNGTERSPFATDIWNGYSSVAQYFNDASNGDFQPEFDLYGPYTADKGHHYYGKKQGHQYDLLKEAVKKADPDIDFTQYDSNNDNKVDIVYVLYAGTGANISGDDNDFWPLCYYGQSISTKDRIEINVIGGANELAYTVAQHPTFFSANMRAGIGVFCHEMSHGLGMPDLYNTTVRVAQYPLDTHGCFDPNNAGPEDWDLMDGGENIYYGIWPCQYTAWEKDLMGWLNVEELTEPATITIYPLNKENGKAYRVTNPKNPQEYYIIENNQSDEWNGYVNYTYGSGLMIWHLYSSASGFTMAPNNLYKMPYITIVPADGFNMSSYSVGKTIWYNGGKMTVSKQTFQNEVLGDPYPGSKNITSLAAYQNYDGTEMVDKFPITDIKKNSDGSISFKFMGGMRGDVNQDGMITEEDAFMVMDYFLGRIESLPVSVAADMNEDGVISIADANQIVNTIVK